ncbi:hypothetical protein [Escherichia coli]|jgi:hypothetical protein|uniref:hypothetical protein n=1 Tax=Escherichia coli TaxID=562 RepID=UPI0017779E23|nr:hypothetical protein [Escherichia coli]MBX8893780.1 hypothetical protein [Escherichia coli]USJ83327.1 hypothetical protein LXH19_06395 [Shigella sp. PIB]HAG7606590.1 hypothetical protein [Escherichia coli]HAJ7563236.1 hypothetical protein [Escherichia coli]
MDGNIKGLVSAGHEMASELKAECGAVDMRSVAKLISDLATQLEVQLVRANALAAENAGLKSGAMDEIKVINRGGQAYCVKDGVQVNPMYARGWNDYRAKSLQSDTPATDAFLAEVKTEARKEGAYFVANRMLAAWEAGFIDDTAKNAADIARMILTSTEFMANAPEGDFDRSFSDGVLEDIAAQLRKGGNQ